MRIRVLRASKEEKVAVAIGRLLSDFHLDLEKVGYYLAKALPYTVYRRALARSECIESSPQWLYSATARSSDCLNTNVQRAPITLPHSFLLG